MSPFPAHLRPLLASPTTPRDLAVDALEEWILSRQAKGESMFQISVGLAELESSTPHFTGPVFARARYVTNLPDQHDLTPLNDNAALTPALIIRHLSTQPTPPMERSRELLLEFCLGKETKFRDKKPGRGGRGTLSRESLEDIAKRLDEVEVAAPPLVLSLRLSLSYFTPGTLSRQLLLLSIPDAEKTLVQHVRRRVAGEGRYAVGKELDHLEQTTPRPALRPAFRSARRRTGLPQCPQYPIPLPAPNKSGVVKMLNGFIKDGSAMSSPRGGGSDRAAIASYALELVSEYLTREKREYMMKLKWARSGREQLTKDITELEKTFHAQGDVLVPIFGQLRCRYGLELSEDYEPDPEEVFREPDVQTTTAALYVNPRLGDSAAEAILFELVESVKEKWGSEGVEEAIDSVARRFPDGSYADVFDVVKGRPSHRRTHSAPMPPRAAHVRTMSSPHATPPTTPRTDHPNPPRILHSPQRLPSNASSPTRGAESSPPPPPGTSPSGLRYATRKQLPPLAVEPQPTRQLSSGSAGWWDVVSAVEPTDDAPWRGSPIDLPLPPGAEPAALSPLMSRLDISDPPMSGSPVSSPPRVTSVPFASHEAGSKPLAPPPPVPTSPARPSFDGAGLDRTPKQTPEAKGKRSFFGRSPTVKTPKAVDKTDSGRWNRDIVADLMGPSASRQRVG